MPVTQLRRYPRIVVDAISAIVSRTGLTDVTDPGRFRRFTAGLSRQLDEAYYQIVRVADVWNLDRAAGEDLDRRVADLQPAGLTRLAARRATSSAVVFSRRTVTGDTRIIPSGTVALTAAGVAVRTTREAEITPTSAVLVAGHLPGQDSGAVPAQALLPGEAGNLIAGAVRRLQGSIVGVDEVTNTAPFLNGRDAETDDELRARAKTYIASLARCGYTAVEQAAIGVEFDGRQVIYARALANPVRRGDVTLFIDDGTGAAESTELVSNELVSAGLLGPPPDRAVGGEEYLFLDLPPVKVESGYAVRVNGVARVNDSTVRLSPTDGVLRFVPSLATGDEVRADYTRYTGLVAEVQRVISGVRGDPDYPGFGAIGVRTRVRTPRVVSPSIAGTLFLRDRVDRATAVAAAESAAVSLVNQLGISDDVVLAQIVDAVMEVAGVHDFRLELPAENIVVLDDEIARISTSQVDFD